MAEEEGGEGAGVVWLVVALRCAGCGGGTSGKGCCNVHGSNVILACGRGGGRVTRWCWSWWRVGEKDGGMMIRRGGGEKRGEARAGIML